ncbi:MAG TPA: DUF2752 domain-containing protein [Thermoanaerobaculia bacterium]|nr:DUF2752 domain-containing protein [Thermoanaerobaculia bacterium]
MSPGRQLAFLWGGVAAALVALSPLAPRFAAALPPCLLKTFTGVPCPSCGTTRAALALGRFDVPTAFAVSPLAAVALLALVGGGLLAAAAAVLREPPEVPALSPRGALLLRVSLAAALLGNWLYLLTTGA